MPSLSLLFSSPRTIRRLLLAGFFAWFSAWLVWLVAYDIPTNNPEVEISVERTFGLSIIFSTLAWATLVSWRELWLELKLGRLLKTQCAHSTFSIDIQTVNGLSVPVLPDRSPNEKVIWPWASLLCMVLLVWAFFQHLSNVSVVPAWSLFLFALLCFWIQKPFHRAAKLFSNAERYEQYIAKAEGKNLLPVGKHLMPVTDSNFYRYYAKRLKTLKFVLLYKCRFHNTFCDPDDTVFVTLGREQRSGRERDFFCLTSVAENGQIFQTHSTDRDLHAVSLLEPNWTFQSVDESDFDAAIAMHKSLMEQYISSQSLLALDRRNFVAFQRYIYEVTARARVRFYNLNQRHFA